MIHCARCHQKTARNAPCKACGSAPALHGRYELVAMLGHGASGITWRARRLADAATVAIKEINFRRLADMKTLELFERETRVLQDLSHPGIPAYLEDFSVEDGRDISLYLVQECIDGQSLKPGEKTWDEAALFGLLREVAGVLDYLNGRRPPVVHRDIKPSNIMRRRDGRYVLIDFGATAFARRGQGGSTVAGTFGYMAPEQFRGLASAASDIYGLGATALALVAGEDAAKLLDPDYPEQWQVDVRMSAGLRELLAEMLRPEATARIQTPGELLAAIDAAENPPGALVRAAAGRAEVAITLPTAARAPGRSLPAIIADYWHTWTCDVSASSKSALMWSAGTTLATYSVLLGLGCTTAFVETLIDARVLYALGSRFDALGASGKMLVMFAPGLAALTLVWSTYFRYRSISPDDTPGKRDHDLYPAQKFLRELVELDFSSRLRTGSLLGAMLIFVSLVAGLLMGTIAPTHTYLADFVLLLIGATGILWLLAPLAGVVYRERLTWRRFFFQIDEVWPDDAERRRFKQVARIFGGAAPSDEALRRGRLQLAKVPCHTPAQQVQLSALHLLDTDLVGSPVWLDALEVIRAQKPAPWRDRLLHEVAMRIYHNNKPRACELLAERERGRRSLPD